MSSTERSKKAVVAIVAVSITVLALAPFIGMHSISISDALTGIGQGGDIFWRIRLPRVLLGFIAGSALGLSGMAFQALFQNPLATPYTLGVASGASFGAVVAIQCGLGGALLGIDIVNMFGLAGALLATGLVYYFSGVSRYRSLTTLLLAGVAMSFLFSSLIMFLQFLSDFTGSFQIVHWLMGGLEVIGFQRPLKLLPFVLLGAVLIFLNIREIDLMATGEEIAHSRGVAVKKVRLLIFVASSLMVGSVVSFTGPIGFIGMMVPHMCRRLTGESHQTLAPVTFLFSGAFLVACDTIARTIIAPAEMPVGVITALLGGPFFLFLLTQAARKQVR